MTHVDGWKDEEADVDDSICKLPSIQIGETVLVRTGVYDFIKSPPTSAQPCGCDLGAGWVCVWHQKARNK